MKKREKARIIRIQEQSGLDSQIDTNHLDSELTPEEGLVEGISQESDDSTN